MNGLSMSSASFALAGGGWETGKNGIEEVLTRDQGVFKGALRSGKLWAGGGLIQVIPGKITV